MKTETWYVMEDGSCGDPREIGPDKDGKLVHSDGRKVAYAPHGPRSRGVEVDADPVKKSPAKTTQEKREAKPEEGKTGYKTRESKAD